MIPSFGSCNTINNGNTESLSNTNSNLTPVNPKYEVVSNAFYDGEDILATVACSISKFLQPSELMEYKCLQVLMEKISIAVNAVDIGDTEEISMEANIEKKFKEISEDAN